MNTFNILPGCLLKTIVKLITLTDFVKFVHNLSTICPQCVLLYNISVCFITRINNMFHMVSTLFSNSCLNFQPRFSYRQGLFPLTNDNVWLQHSDASFIAFLIWMVSQTACYKFHIQMCHIHHTFHWYVSLIRRDSWMY